MFKPLVKTDIANVEVVMESGQRPRGWRAGTSMDDGKATQRRFEQREPGRSIVEGEVSRAVGLKAWTTMIYCPSVCRTNKKNPRHVAKFASSATLCHLNFFAFLFLDFMPNWIIHKTILKSFLLYWNVLTYYQYDILVSNFNHLGFKFKT